MVLKRYLNQGIGSPQGSKRHHRDYFLWRSNIDELVKSRKTPFVVIPAKAGIQFFQLVTGFLDSDFHRSDDFLRDRQYWFLIHHSMFIFFSKLSTVLPAQKKLSAYGREYGEQIAVGEGLETSELRSGARKRGW